MIRHFMTFVNDGRAALLTSRKCTWSIFDMFAAVQRINLLHSLGGVVILHITILNYLK